MFIVRKRAREKRIYKKYNIYKCAYRKIKDTMQFKIRKKSEHKYLNKEMKRTEEIYNFSNNMDL